MPHSDHFAWSEADNPVISWCPRNSRTGAGDVMGGFVALAGKVRSKSVVFPRSADSESERPEFSSKRFVTESAVRHVCVHELEVRNQTGFSSGDAAGRSS